MAGFFNLWSKTAASNSNADSTINWAEGQLPSTVNGSARAEMAALASFRDDINGSLTTGGSANAYTLTANIAFTALATGLMVAFKANHTNTGAATLAANSLTAKALRTQADAALVAGQLVSGGKYYALYDETANGSAGAWLVQNPSPAIATNAEMQTGTSTAVLATPSNHVTSHEPRFRVTRTASQSLTVDTYEKVEMDGEALDSDGAFDAVTNHRFLPLVAGDYFICASGTVAADAGIAGVAIYLNGTAIAQDTKIGDSGGSTLRASCSTIVALNGSTDYIEMFAISSFATPSVSVARLAGFRIGPST